MVRNDLHVILHDCFSNIIFLGRDRQCRQCESYWGNMQTLLALCVPWRLPFASWRYLGWDGPAKSIKTASEPARKRHSSYRAAPTTRVAPRFLRPTETGRMSGRDRRRRGLGRRRELRISRRLRRAASSGPDTIRPPRRRCSPRRRRRSQTRQH
jgi:hypothetical protein